MRRCVTKHTTEYCFISKFQVSDSYTVWMQFLSIASNRFVRRIIWKHWSKLKSCVGFLHYLLKQMYWMKKIDYITFRNLSYFIGKLDQPGHLFLKNVGLWYKKIQQRCWYLSQSQAGAERICTSSRQWFLIQAPSLSVEHFRIFFCKIYRLFVIFSIRSASFLCYWIVKHSITQLVNFKVYMEIAVHCALL